MAGSYKQCKWIFQFKKYREFATSWVTISFSRKNLLHWLLLSHYHYRTLIFQLGLRLQSLPTPNSVQTKQFSRHSNYATIIWPWNCGSISRLTQDTLLAFQTNRTAPGAVQAPIRLVPEARPRRHSGWSVTFYSQLPLWWSGHLRVHRLIHLHWTCSLRSVCKLEAIERSCPILHFICSAYHLTITILIGNLNY